MKSDQHFTLLLGFWQADIDSGESISTVTVEAMPPATDFDPVSSSAQSTVVLPQAPGVSITKHLSTKTTNLGLDQTVVDAGDALTYTLSVENVGNTWLSAVSVIDPNVENITCSPDLSASSSRFNVGAEKIVCTGSVPVDQAMINAGYFESESRVSAPLHSVISMYNLPGVLELTHMRSLVASSVLCQVAQTLVVCVVRKTASSLPALTVTQIMNMVERHEY